MSYVDYFSNFMHKITSGNHFGIQICHALKMYICQQKFFLLLLKIKLRIFINEAIYHKPKVESPNTGEQLPFIIKKNADCELTVEKINEKRRVNK